MLNFSLNHPQEYSFTLLGDEKTPLLVIDNFAQNPSDLISAAGEGDEFIVDANNFYPGKRKTAPKNYIQQLETIVRQNFLKTLKASEVKKVSAVSSAFAISDLPEHKLRPMQMLPHFDTTLNNQFAVVHYLCSSEHGGTAFYRHKKTRYESISQERLPKYAAILKAEAIANQLHKKPCYMAGSNTMFEEIFSVEAKMNRIIIYPSNVLHSGKINTALGLSSDPKKGRLTIGSFIKLE